VTTVSLVPGLLQPETLGEGMKFRFGIGE